MLRVEEEDEPLPMAPVCWDESGCRLMNQPFTPYIFDGPLDDISSEFNAIVIPVEGQWQTELNWNEARQQALKAVKKGLKLFWQMDLGLFDRLPLALEHVSQLMGLELSLKYFCQTLWKEFESETLGISIFRGSMDYAQALKWTPDQRLAYQEWAMERVDCNENTQLTLFAADVACHYFLTLIRRLPDALPLFLLLDATQISSLQLQARLSVIERYDRILLAIKGGQVPMASLVWEEGIAPHGFFGQSTPKISSNQAAILGIVLPSIQFKQSIAYEGLEELLRDLQHHVIPYRMISEERLALDWAELEALCFFTKGLTEAGKRQLRGFSAAGGTLIAVQDTAGLLETVTWEKWLQTELQMRACSA